MLHNLIPRPAVTERLWRYVGSGHTPGAALIAAGIAEDLPSAGGSEGRRARRAVGPITALPDPEPRQPLRSALPRHSDERGVSLIESEIVIVDDDGTETPFDPASWFE